MVIFQENKYGGFPYYDFLTKFIDHTENVGKVSLPFASFQPLSIHSYNHSFYDVPFHFYIRVLRHVVDSYIERFREFC